MAFQGKTIGRNAETAVKRAALAADTAVVLNTPVDTGRARGNWLASIGAPRAEELGVEGGQTGATAQVQAEQEVRRWKLGMGPIFLVNNVPYILRLEQGHSKQAPQGMTQFAIAAAKLQLRKARLLG